MRLVYRPLPAIWPSGARTTPQDRRRSPFRSQWTATMRELERELRQIGAEEPIVIEAGFQEGQIRNDGLPRAGVNPNDPAIVISFKSRFGPLRYGCDAFWPYEANLRAIALALEALRKVDRYGVTKRGEQYQGWKALPENTMSASDARDWLKYEAAKAGAPPEVLRADNLTGRYRFLLKLMHPDAETGSREQFETLQRVKLAVGL